MSEIRVVHVSNLHLGCRFPGFERETESLRIDDINRVFIDLKNYIIENSVSLLLVAGDLFDKMNPGRETISMVLDAFGEIGQRLPGTKIVLTPGREEMYVGKDGKIDCNLDVLGHLPNIRILGAGHDPETELFEFGGMKVRVTSARVDRFFERGFRKKKIADCENEPGIFLLSTCLHRGGADRISEDLLKEKVLAPIREKGYRYAALGGRQRLNLIESGEFTAVYSGGLEHFDIEQDRDRKCFVTFTIKDGEFQDIETVRSSARPLEYINITCNADSSLSDLENAVSDLGGRGDRDKMLYVVLNGRLPADIFDIFTGGEKVRSLTERFACVHIENKLMMHDTERDYDVDALNVYSPAEEFRRTVEREIQEAEERGEDAQYYEDILEMGLREIEEGP